MTYYYSTSPSKSTTMPAKSVANISAMGFAPDYTNNLYYTKGGDVCSHNKHTKKKSVVIKGAFVRLPKHAYYIKSVRGAYVIEGRPMDEMKKKAMASRTANAKVRAAKLVAKKKVAMAKKLAKKPKKPTKK